MPVFSIAYPNQLQSDLAHDLALLIAEYRQHLCPAQVAEAVMGELPEIFKPTQGEGLGKPEQKVADEATALMQERMRQTDIPQDEACHLRLTGYAFPAGTVGDDPCTVTFKYKGKHYQADVVGTGKGIDELAKVMTQGGE